MNILHLRSSNFYGGPERQLHFHAKKAIGTKYNIVVSSFSENGQQPEFLKVISADNLRTHTFNVSNAYDPRAIKSVKYYLSKFKIDIIATHDYRTHLVGMLASRRINVKWLAFSRGWTTENVKIRFYHLLDKFFIRFADQIIAVSYAQKMKLGSLFINSNKITVAHNAIDPLAFNDINPIDLKRKYHFPDDSLVGISGGRFSSEKGQRFLVEAAAIAIKKNNNLKFILFGDGPDYQNIQFRIKQLNLQNNVVCAGFEKNLIGHIKGADFLINPSLSEGLPNIILEAMAMKVPCLATDVGGVGEIIENDSNGLLVASRSPKQLATAILKIAEKEKLYYSIREKAYQTIIDKFSFDRQYRIIEKVYYQLVKN